MDKPGWMTQERARRIREKAEEQVADEMRRLQESGEISHLHGQPLNIDDDPDWLITRVLKSQGYSHPLLEAARDLDEPRKRAEDVLNRLQRRYRWLTDPSSGCTSEQAEAFNALREEALAEYRSRLETLNRAIRDYNLSVPEALHQRPVRIEPSVARAAGEIPPIAAPEKPRRKRRWLRR